MKFVINFVDIGQITTVKRSQSGDCFSKVRKTPLVKLQPSYSVNLLFSYVVKGIKIKITLKFRASSRLRFEDIKRIMSPEMRPKSFETFEKRAKTYVDEMRLQRDSFLKLN